MHLSYTVGAYAALARGIDAPGEDAVYGALQENDLVRGFELPFRGSWTADDLAQMAKNAGPKDVVITTIPGLAGRAQDDPSFGPASPHRDGWEAALAFFQEAWRASTRLGDIIGPDRITAIVVASAPRADRPTIPQRARHLAEFLERISEWSWGATRVVLEHCDAFSEDHTMAKGFLPLEEEIAAMIGSNRDSLRPTGLSINWGRSAIEGRGPSEATRHLNLAIQSGILYGLTFSGCSDADTEYGPAWADVHLPPADDDGLPTYGSGSLLTPSLMNECLSQLPERESVSVGLKVTTPNWADVGTRIDIVSNSLQILSNAELAKVE